MACKFVINDGRLVISNVEFHYQICKNNDKTIGGGYWHWDRKNKIVYFYSDSSDFGAVTKEQIEESLRHNETFISPFFEGSKFMYSPYSLLSDVLNPELSNRLEEIKNDYPW